MASKRKCKQCSTRTSEFILVGLRAFCNYECATKFGMANKSKGEAVKNKEAKKKHKQAKENLKSKAKWLAELQVLINKCVRIRDSHDGCISCEKIKSWSGQWHASHYYSRGHSSGLRFNMWNIHKSCSVCNSHLSGNIGEYTPRLIEKIGQDRYDWLLAHKSDLASYDIEWIKRAIKIARKAVKRYERRL